jgi:hypothetical protein
MSKKKIFIQANDKQYFGALLARYAIDRFQIDGERIPIQIINTDDLPTFQALHGKRYWQNRRSSSEIREFSGKTGGAVLKSGNFPLGTYSHLP